MLALYLFCIALGGVLIAASMVFGDADVDVDADADFDADADADADSDSDGGLEWSVLPFGSLRFWTFLVECFGLTGALLTLVGIPSAWTIGISLTMGSVMGWMAFQFFRWLAHEEVTADVGLARLSGEEAVCIVAIRGSGSGKIRISSLPERVEVLACSADSRDIERGAKVLVVSVKEGIAEVTTLLPAGQTAQEIKRNAQAVAAQQVEGGP